MEFDHHWLQCGLDVSPSVTVGTTVAKSKLHATLVAYLMLLRSSSDSMAVPLAGSSSLCYLG